MLTALGTAENADDKHVLQLGADGKIFLPSHLMVVAIRQHPVSTVLIAISNNLTASVHTADDMDYRFHLADVND